MTSVGVIITDVGHVDALVESKPFDRRPAEGLGFESHSSCHVGTLGKSLTRSCLHSIRAVSEALPSISGVKRRYRNGLNE